MGRKILFITTDQQRYDALGCNGGRIARTPVADRLAAEGIRYERAHNQNVVCMPARATMLTGQLVRTHGVIANGIPLPPDGCDVAATLRDTGYRTALIGKAHFEPASDPGQSYFENWAASRGSYGPHRGFERMELAGHTGRAGRSLFHYPKWLRDHHPEAVEGYYLTIDAEQRVNGAGGGDSGAPQVWRNPIPRALYHTDWVAERAIDWLGTLAADDDWFLWMSFPDPHHPWDPPQSELARIPWREVPLPDGYPGSASRAARILADKPRHWLAWFEGRERFAFEVPPSLRPCDLTPDQIREVNACVHVENELIDEACGRVLEAIARRGWGEETDVVLTTDHGELQGDFGLLFKGPYHVDALMRVPLLWRPARCAGIPPAVVEDPVGHLDLAPTFCRIAGVAPPAAMQGRPLPLGPGADGGRERVITEWDGDFGGHGIHLRSIFRDGWLATAYEPSNYYAGTEGELYDLTEDPRQWRNLWDDPARRALREELVADLRAHLPAPRDPPLARVALV